MPSKIKKSIIGQPTKYLFLQPNMQDKTFLIDGNLLITGKISDSVYLRPDVTEYIYLPDRIVTDTPTLELEAAPTEKFITETITQKVYINPRPLLIQRHEWQVGLLVFSLLILSLAKLTRKNFLKSIQKGISSRPMFRQLFRDGLLYSPQSRIPVFFVHSIIISIIIYQSNDWYHLYQFKNTSRQLLDFLIIFGAVTGFILLKTISIKLAGFIFKTQSQASEYLSNIFFFNTIAAMLFIPLLIFSVYVPTDFVIVVIIILAIILFIFRLVRGLIISLDNQNYSFYQKIMYFCALEILPVIWIGKVLAG